MPVSGPLWDHLPPSQPPPLPTSAPITPPHPPSLKVLGSSPQQLCVKLARFHTNTIYVQLFPQWCNQFLPDPGVWGPVYGSRCLYLCTSTLWNFADVTLADDDTNSILADDANRAIWGWWSSFRWWSSPMLARRSLRGSAGWWSTRYRRCMEYWSWCAGELWSCWRQYMLLGHYH